MHPTNRLLCDLIEKPSITPDDQGCQKLLGERLVRLGFACESMPFADVSNLWARRGNDSPLFCFAGHTDVVPPGPLSDWQSDPFVATVCGDRIFGRGAADMKAGLAAMVTAAERFVADYPAHRGSISFLITSDEEGPARDGTRRVVEALTERGESIDWCVIGEPSSTHDIGDCVRIGRRGSLSGVLSVNGIQGHVAYPDLADNPIRRAVPVIETLLREVWDHGNRYFPPTNLEFVNIESGAGAPNVIPGTLRARFNLRYCNEWNHVDLKRHVESLVRAHEVDFTIDWHLSGEPFFTPPGELTSAVANAVQGEVGRTPEFSTSGGTSDGRFIAPSGAQVVELGATNGTIHKVNECVHVDEAPQLAEVYYRILLALLA